MKVILPYLTIVTIQIKNVINENDFEFSMSAMTSNYLSMTRQTTANTAIGSASATSISSVKAENQPNHQQDVIKICVLLFDNYQKLCMPPSNTDEINLSRQSARESILPGLVILKDIFHNKIIQISNQNEFLSAIETMINKIEYVQSDTQHATPSKAAQLENAIRTASSISVSTSGSLVNDLVSASVSSLSPLSLVNNINSSDLSSNLPENNNFKSLMFKGISNFNHSKDKLSNLLTQKNLKK